MTIVRNVSELEKLVLEILNYEMDDELLLGSLADYFATDEFTDDNRPTVEALGKLMEESEKGWEFIGNDESEKFLRPSLFQSQKFGIGLLRGCLYIFGNAGCSYTTHFAFRPVFVI